MLRRPIARVGASHEDRTEHTGGQGREGERLGRGDARSSPVEGHDHQQQTDQAQEDDENGFLPATSPGAEHHPEDLGPARPREVQQQGREHGPEGPDEGGDDEEGKGEPELGPEEAAQRQRARQQGAVAVP